MSLDTILNLPIEEDDFSYNVKWTLLMHVRHIVRGDTFVKQFDKLLPDESFLDSTPFEYGQDPIFGVEYMGMREGSESSVDPQPGGMYIIAFRGVSAGIRPKSEYGVDSRNRRLLFLHDSI